MQAAIAAEVDRLAGSSAISRPIDPDIPEVLELPEPPATSKWLGFARQLNTIGR